MTDIITNIIFIFQKKISTVTPEIAQEIEKEIRDKWGKEQIYISTRCALVESKKQKINRELSAGRSIQQIEELHGIPRRTIYRLINHKHE